MVELRKVSDEELVRLTKDLVAEERRLTTLILWHLCEVRRRRLFAKLGYANLFEYAVSLGYSQGAAGRRIAAMKVLAQVPEVEKPLESGRLSLSALCSAYHFFKRNEAPISRQEKGEILKSLEGKSRRECDRFFATLAPEPVPADRERAISAELTEIRFVADASLMEKLEKIKGLDAHVNPNPSYLELFHRLADLALKKLDPEKRQSGEKRAVDSVAEEVNRPDTPQRRSPATPPAELKSESIKIERRRYVPASVKRAVWIRDGGRCVFHGINGRKCGSRFGLELDHKIPIALGGETTLENLRILCRTHNQQAAIDAFGVGKMSRYLDLKAP